MSDSNRFFLKKERTLRSMYFLFSPGVATSFFNDKNRNIVRDLVELLTETNQDLPAWLESMASDMNFPQASRRGGGSKSKFGARDYRQQSSGKLSYQVFCSFKT